MNERYDMREIICIVIVSLIAAGASAAPDFVGNHYVGQSPVQLTAKYGGALEKFNCGSDTSLSCASKGLKCECRAVRLISEATHGRTLLATIANQRVISYSDIYTVSPRTNLQKILPSVRSFFGEEKPSQIYDLTTGGEGYQGQFLVWQFTGGEAQAVVFCPVTMVAGVKKVEAKVRDCLLKDARIYTHKSVELPPEAKNKSKFEY